MKNFYSKTFCIRLKNKTLLVSDVIFSGSKPDNNEFWSLGNPAVIQDKNDSISLEPFEFEPLDAEIYSLAENEIYAYSEPTFEILEQYNMYQYLIRVDALAS